MSSTRCALSRRGYASILYSAPLSLSPSLFAIGTNAQAFGYVNTFFLIRDISTFKNASWAQFLLQTSCILPIYRMSLSSVFDKCIVQSFIHPVISYAIIFLDCEFCFTYVFYGQPLQLISYRPIIPSTLRNFKSNFNILHTVF